MAIWQVDFELKKEKTESWHKLEKSLKDLYGFLPPTKSWDENLKLFGDIDSSCLEIYLKNDKIAQMQLRLDVRNINSENLNKTVEFIKNNDLKVFYKNNLIEPKIESFQKVLLSSDSYKYLSNPEQFLNSL